MREPRNAVITVGSSSVYATYPQRIGDWFEDLAGQDRDGAAARAWVRVEDEPEHGRFRITTSSGLRAAGLELADVLAMFWEHVTFLLVDRLDDAFAVHAAAVRRGDDLVLLPGASGTGKTQLSLWYRAQGFALATDELVTFSSTRENPDQLWASALARPLFLKGAARATVTLPQGSLRALYGASDGELLKLAGMASAPPQRIDAGFIVFPRYEPGSPLQLTALSSAQAGMRLLEHCVNVRNLSRGGLPVAAAIARRCPAVSLRYGETGQLTGTLDVLTRQVLAANPGKDDLAVLCDGVTAHAASRRISVAAASTAHPNGAIVPVPDVVRPARRLTIGMATYDEYDGVYFTIQSIRLHHPELAGAIEFIVVDNNPEGPCAEALKQLESWIDGYRYVPRGDRRSTAIRDVVFEEASCEIVLCIDPHVLIVPGALGRLVDYCQATPASRDLLQGPLLYDDLRTLATHFEPRWRAGMYGTWELDPRGADPGSPPFEIPMQGLGLFACRRDAWPGFNPAFRGFGGEEGYIHEKTRRRGGRTLCLPFLRWVHRFARPLGTPYPNRWEDRMHNYFVGFTELGIDTTELEAHFTELIGVDHASRIFAEIRATLPDIRSPSKADCKAQEPQDSAAMPLSEEIYSPHNYSFGDQWATINFYLNMSVMKQQRIRLASRINGVSLHRLHEEILEVLDSAGEIELIQSEPTVGLDGYNVWNAPYFPTRRRWDASKKHTYVCMQFDGQSAGEVTNPGPEEEMSIRTLLGERCHGLRAITLGKQLSVRECVDIAADSALFVGVDSGMSHLCHSVGVPVFLLEYRLPTITTHAGKAHVLCRGFEDFAGRFDRHVDYLHAAGSPDADSISQARPRIAVSAAETTTSTSVDVADGQGEGRSLVPPRASETPPGFSDEPVQRPASDRHSWIRRVLSLLTPHVAPGFSKVRIGGEHDGGYLMIDDLRGIRLCYSLGIGADAGWDYDMAQRGMAVFQYDHTVAAPPSQHPRFHFNPIGIASADGGNMRTIQTLLDENGHAGETEMILKMDIEGAEWDVLDSALPLTLDRFRQIVCEFHGFSALPDPGWCERAERIFLKLSGTHVPVHVHGNNFAPFSIVEGVPIPDVMEVTYVRRSSYTVERSTELFPSEFDRPNRADSPDLYLGRFEF